MISSIRSWSQNTGPTAITNRLKLLVIIGRDKESFEDNNIGPSGSILFLGLNVVELEEAPGWGVRGGKEADNRSWGIDDNVGDAIDDVTDDSNEGLCFRSVGDAGGEGLGRDTVVLGASCCS